MKAAKPPRQPRTWTRYDRTIKHTVPAAAGWTAVYVAGLAGGPENAQMVTLPIAAFVIGSETRWKCQRGKAEVPYQRTSTDDEVLGVVLFEDAGVEFLPKIEWFSQQWWEDVSTIAGIAAPGQDPRLVYRRALATYKASLKGSRTK